MKSSLLFKSSIIALICFLLVFILSLLVFNESFHPVLDYNDDVKVKISTTINALTTPVISLISVILLYITLSKQIESNYFQKKAKNLDLILVMYNQLQVDYDHFSYTKRGNKGPLPYENKFNGFDALYENLASFRKEPEKFGPSYQSDKIIRLVHTFTLTESLIQTMDLEKEAKNLLNQNIESFYKTSFKPVFLSLAYLIRNNTNAYSLEMINFVTNQERKDTPDFDIKNFEKEGDLFKGYYNN